jgi:hypothetical protein
MRRQWHLIPFIILLTLLPVGVFAANPIPNTNWSLKFVDSQETLKEYAPATNAFDGSQSSYWHTAWSVSPAPPPPHEMQIDLGFGYSISGFRYLPRQDGSVNGRIGQYEFYVSSDGVNWGSAVATGTFANDATQKEVDFTAKTGRFVRLRALSEVNGKAWTSAAEISVLGTPGSGNQPPTCVMDKPSKDITIAVGDQGHFLGSAGDPDNNTPLSYLWSFGTNSGVANATVEDPGFLTFSLPGSYPASFQAKDALGLACPSPQTRVVNVAAATPLNLPNFAKVSIAPFPVSVPPGITNPVLTAAQVTDVTAQFVADPFLFHDDNGAWWLFFEVALSTDTPGYIGVASSTDGLHWTYQKTVLKESFHLSYPFVFKSDGKYYLMPETNEINEIRLYETSNFPYDWKYSKTLVSGQRFVDSQILWFNGTWWLFSSDVNDANLYLYYADTLAGPWTQHPMSPVVVDAGKARGAGRIFVFDQDRIIRPGQKNDVSYGQSVRIFEIDVLSKTSYLEHELTTSPLLTASGAGWNAKGMHQFDPWWVGNQWLCSADGVDSSGNWSIGLYQLTDTVAPTAAITSPASGSAVSGTVTVTASASDNVGISKVELYVNGSLSATDTASPYSFAWNTAGLASGSYTLMVKAYDAAGNVGPSGNVTVTLNNDHTPPITAITSPVNGAAVSGSVTVTASASDNVGVSKVELYLNGTLSAVDTASPYSFTWDTTFLANGSAQLQTKAYDPSGNVGQSGIVTVNVNNDHTPPTASITSPAAGSTVSGTLTVTASASDNTAVSKVEFYVRGALYATDSAAPYSFAWDSTKSVNGSCDLTVKAYDAAGNVGTSATVTVTILNAAAAIPNAGWKLLYVDSQELAAENGAATNAFDGNAATFWHTQWSSASPPPPHEIQIDLGKNYDVSGFHYLPRQDGSPNGRIGQYEFYASIDGVDWGLAAASGTFANDASEKEVLFPVRTIRFVRLRALSEVNGNPWTCVAELKVLGTASSGNQPPNGTITSPAANVTITTGATVQFSGTGADPDSNLPLTYRWSFGAGSGVADSSLQNPGTVQFNVPGTYTVTFTVTDALGSSDPTPASVVVTVRNSVNVIPRTGWKLLYVDSQELVGENAAATNAFDGNSATFWHTQWFSANPPPPHEIQIDLGAAHSISGFRYLPRQDGSVNGTIGKYEFYLSSDGVNWGSAVATGTFAGNTAEKEVDFSTANARYVRLRALSEINGNPWTSAAELNVLGQ